MTSSANPTSLAADALRGHSAWVVGGALRDELLGRPSADIDIVVDGDAGAAARTVARAVRGPAFELSDEFESWRVMAPDRSWQIDLSPLRGGSLSSDLALRDFTINAIAQPLGGGERVDPHGGAEDLAAGRLRAVGRRSLADDPLRVVRLVRLAGQLGLAPDEETIALARASASDTAAVAQERVFAELKGIVAGDGVIASLALMDEIGLTAAILPELHALHGVDQNRYHHADVHAHTIEVLEQAIALQADPAAVFGSAHAGAISTVLAEPLADEVDRGFALRLGALLHDVAKPATLGRREDGSPTFLGHDRAGAALARDILTRLKASEKLKAHVAALTRHHLRLGFLVHEMPLSRRALYRYLTASAPVEVDVTLLSVADRLATRGRKAHESIARHLELAREVMPAALQWRAQGRRTPLVRGDALAAALELAGGPELGRLLAAIDEAHFAGEVTNADEAVAVAARLREGGEATRTTRLPPTMAAADPDCLFCKIVAGEIPATVVAQDERTIAFMDINPATRGHVLVIPRVHARDVHEIETEDLKAVAATAQLLATRQLERLGADGVNLVNSNGRAAWQTVFHFHMHVIPRYAGDPLKLPWVPAPGDTDDVAAAGAQLAQ